MAVAGTYREELQLASTFLISEGEQVEKDYIDERKVGDIPPGYHKTSYL